MQKCKVSEINAKIWKKNWDPWSQNFAEIALCHTISEIKDFLGFLQKLKMAAKIGRRQFFGKSRQMTLNALGVKNFVKITPSGTISEINAF